MTHWDFQHTMNFKMLRKGCFQYCKYFNALSICDNCKICDGENCTTLIAKLQANGTNTNCDEGTKKHLK